MNFFPNRLRLFGFLSFPRNFISRQYSPRLSRLDRQWNCLSKCVPKCNLGTRNALLVLTFFLFPFLLHADSPDTELDAANRAYTYGSYDESAELFQQIIAARGYSGPLCFDLANAEARAGHTGAAILNYERARYLAPADPDIDHNLQLARKQAGLEPNSYRWWEIVLRSINWTVWLGIMAALLLLIFLAVIGTALKIPLRLLKNIFRAILFAGIPLCLLMGYVELSTVGFNDRIEGVVVAPKAATLRLSPFDSADSIGTIPEGELVTVEDRHNDYLRIEARDYHFGWIQEKDIAPVIAGSFDVKPSN
jgi:tetratricopeptide (TPR) repeat protein